jgi:hypothetical protein
MQLDQTLADGPIIDVEPNGLPCMKETWQLFSCSQVRIVGVTLAANGSTFRLGAGFYLHTYVSQTKTVEIHRGTAARDGDPLQRGDYP